MSAALGPLGRERLELCLVGRRVATLGVDVLGVEFVEAAALLRRRRRDAVRRGQPFLEITQAVERRDEARPPLAAATGTGRSPPPPVAPPPSPSSAAIAAVAVAFLAALLSFIGVTRCSL